MADENVQPSSSSMGNNSLRLGNRKKPWVLSILFVISSYFYSRLSSIRHSIDPLVHHGRHFGRTVYAMCNVRSLITDALLWLEESDDGEISEESLTTEYIVFFGWSIRPMNICFLFCRARAEHNIFQKLQAMVPNLMDRVVESEAALAVVAESVWVFFFT